MAQITPAQHEARIDRCEAELLACETPELRRSWGQLFIAAVHERNAQRTPEQVAQLERAMGLA